jgi:hypothetical protein
MWVVVQYANEQNILIGPFKTITDAVDATVYWAGHSDGLFSVKQLIAPEDFTQVLKNKTLLDSSNGL